MTQRFELVYLTLSASHEVPGEAKRFTLFYVLPFGGSQNPRVLDNSWQDMLCRAVLSYPAEAVSDFPIL